MLTKINFLSGGGGETRRKIKFSCNSMKKMTTHHKSEKISIEFPIEYVEHLFDIITANKPFPENIQEITGKIDKHGKPEKLGFKLAVRAIEHDNADLLSNIEFCFSGFGNKETEELVNIAKKHNKHNILNYFQVGDDELNDE